MIHKHWKTFSMPQSLSTKWRVRKYSHYHIYPPRRINFILLEDISSFVPLEDSSSFILLEDISFPPGGLCYKEENFISIGG